MDPRLSYGLRAATAAVAIAGSWQYGYQPAARRSQSDAAQLTVLAQQLTQVTAMVQQAGGEAAWLTRHQQRLEQLRTKFARPDQMPQLLNALVDALQTGKLHVVNVTQGALEPVRYGESPLLIDGLPCARLPVTIAAEGRYHVLIDALDQLAREAFPAVVSLGQMELRANGADAGGAKVTANVRVFIYVVGSVSVSEPHA